jgi:hypothetical protein
MYVNALFETLQTHMIFLCVVRDPQVLLLLRLLLLLFHFILQILVHHLVDRDDRILLVQSNLQPLSNGL